MKMYFFKGIKIAFLFLFIGKFRLAYPFGEVMSVDIRSLSLGQMRALSQGLINPAYIPFLEQKQLGVSVLNRFEMKELSTRSVFGLIPNRLIDMNFHLSVFGYEDYQLIEGKAGFAKKLSQNFSVGTSLGYLTENSILEEKIRSHLYADISLYWLITDNLEWALTTENLLHSRNNQSVFCHTGLKYRLIPAASALLESGFDSRNRFSVSAGLEYEIVEQLMVRGGFRNNLKAPALGFAYVADRWSVETAFLFHQEPGVSGGIAVRYCF